MLSIQKYESDVKYLEILGDPWICWIWLEMLGLAWIRLEMLIEVTPLSDRQSAIGKTSASHFERSVII